MSTLKKKINKILQLRRRALKTNVQKVLYSLLKADNKWISRISFRIPSTGSRLRDLRTDKFGGLPVVCVRANDFKLKRYSVVTKQPTYYGLDLSHISEKVLEAVFRDIV